MDEFHESGGVASISGVEGEEWAVPGLLGSRVDCKRMTLSWADSNPGEK
jgi:hypothetical protein